VTEADAPPAVRHRERLRRQSSGPGIQEPSPVLDVARSERLRAYHERAATGLLRILTLDRAVRWSAAVATALFAGWLVVVVAIPALDDRPGRLLWPDFLSFYTAGSFVLDGRIESLYDVEAQRAFQRELVAPQALAGVNLYLNPPFAALFYAPFAALPFVPALLLWWALGLGALAFALDLLRRELAPQAPPPLLRLLGAAFLFLPTLFWIMYAQSSAFSLALLTTAFVCLRRGRDLPAGLVLGCLAYKPQLALALGCVLLVKGRGWALLGGAVSVCVWVALGIAMSPESTLAYLELSPELANLMRREGYQAWGLSSFYGFGVLLLDGSWPAATVPVASALSAAALLALALGWRRVTWLPGSEGWDFMMAGTLAWGLLVSPHLYHYDLLLLLLPLLVVASRLRGWPDTPERRVLLAWTAVVCVASGLGHYVTRLQLELAAQVGWPALALQTSVLAAAVWGGLLLLRGGSQRDTHRVSGLTLAPSRSADPTS
jgi:hypothetical protein